MAENIDYKLRVIQDNLRQTIQENTKRASLLDSALSTAIGVFTGGAALGAIKRVGSALSGAFSGSIEAANIQEKAVNDLNNALARTGTFTVEASKDFQDFASSLQSISTVGDEATLSSIALLRSLTTLDNEGIKTTTKAAADLSAVIGVDLSTATELLAKAQIGQTDALRRYGIVIEKTTSNSENFNRVIEKIQTQFGGAAEAQLRTFGGAFQALQNSIGDLREVLGGLITENPLFVAAIRVFKDGVNAAAAAITENKQVISDFIQTSLFSLIDAAAFTAQGMDVLARSFQLLASTGKLAFNGLNLIVFDFADGFLTSIQAVSDVIPGLSADFSETINTIRQLSGEASSQITQNFSDIEESLTQTGFFGALGDGIDAFKEKLIEQTQAVSAANGVINNSNAGRLQSEIDVSQQILNEREKLKQQLLLLEGQYALEEENFQNQIREVGLQNTFERQEAELQRIRDFNLAKIELEFEQKEQEARLIEDAELRKLSIEKVNQDKRLAIQRVNGEARVKARDQELKKLDALEQGYLTALSGTLNAGIALTKRGSREQQKIASAQALINTYQAGTRAYRDFPFPANIAVLAATVAQGLAQVSAINRQSFATGGVVGGFSGSSMGTDNTTANVRNGEMILNANQQESLFKQINGGTSGDIVIQIDGREVFRAVRNQLKQGMTFA